VIDGEIRISEYCQRGATFLIAWSIFIQIFVVDSEKPMYSETVRNDRSRSPKVVDFGSNRKRACDFLLSTATLVFKAKNLGQPAYLHDLLQKYQPTRTLRSSTAYLLGLHQPYASTSVSSRAFSVAAPTVWNQLTVNTQWSSNGLCSMCKAQGPTSLRGPLGLN